MTDKQENLYQLLSLIKHTPNHLLNLLLIKHNLEDCLVKEISLNFSLRSLAGLNTSLELCQKSVSYLEAPSQISSLNCSSTFVNSEIGFKNIPQKTKKIKNDTKNIPKNFGKAIISFIEQRELLVIKLFNYESKDYNNFMKALRCKKKCINSIASLRSLWIEGEFEYCRELRILSEYFLRKGSLEYIFGSRIANCSGHVKYRKRLMEGLRNPECFTFIKN